MDTRDDMDLAPDGSTKVQRACDSCRSRKIRCDRATPCSNCRASKLNCVTTAPTQKAQKQRVHISDEYERKIDRIEDRLAGIEQVLENLALKLGNLDIQREPTERSSQTRSNKVSRSPNSTSISEVIAPNSTLPFEGETTFNSQSEMARDYLEQAVGNTPSIVQNADLKAALRSLQDMVTRQGQKSSKTPQAIPAFAHSLAEIDPVKLERPPWAAVEEVLEKASNFPTMCFSIVFPFLALQNQKAIFKETFDFPDEASTGRRILVYGVLYNLFMEFACYPAIDRRVEPHRQYANICRIQMETAMSQMHLVLPPTYENVLALLLAGAYAIELSKPSLCWVMTSQAIGLCQALGYHRYSTMKDDPEEQRTAKIHAFWFLYMLDKNLSLRLGRASSFQDWDMSLPYPTSQNMISRRVPAPPVTDALVYWIKVSQIQGKTYELLFSPAAFLKSKEERSQISVDLVNQLDQAWSERGEFKLEFPQSYGEVGDLFYHADIATHYSTASLIQRAVSSDNVTFSPECIESARAALVAHQRCSEKFNIKGNEDLWSGYVHWSVLQAPFTPFIVIFSNSITSCDPTDLASLSSFVSSLESCRTVSEGADKLYKMCHLFLQVAKIYVEAKTKEASEILSRQTNQNIDFVAGGGPDGTTGFDANTMTQFDPYLSALGLVPNSSWPMANTFPQLPPGLESATGAGGGFAQGFDQSIAGGLEHNSVQDWFSGSRYIMGLMEEDINMPDLNQ